MAAEKHTDQSYPFLSLQMNSFLQRVRQPEYQPAGLQSEVLYRKPEALCKPIVNEIPTGFWRDTVHFARDWRDSISEMVETFGLNIRTISNEDTPAIIDFLNRRYPPELAKEICAFDLYRFKKYGHGVILHDKSGQVKGNVFEVGYNTREETSYTIRLAVDQDLKGQNLGYHIMMYSSLLAMEQGSKVKRGLIQFDNHQSLHINLNKVGWICTGFEPDIKGLGSFFEIGLPLDLKSLTVNAVDLTQVETYLNSRQKGRDYRLIATHRMDEMIHLYRNTDFKVAAFLKPGIIDDQSYFLALSPQELSFQ